MGFWKDLAALFEPSSPKPRKVSRRAPSTYAEAVAEAKARGWNGFPGVRRGAPDKQLYPPAYLSGLFGVHEQAFMNARERAADDAETRSLRRRR